MAGFRRYGELDSPIVTDGDNRFVGVNSYVELESVPPTFLEKGFDVRINDKENANVIITRKGLDFLAGLSGISPSYIYSRGDEQCFGFGVYSDPDDDKKDWLVVATKKAAIIWNENNRYYVNYYSATADATPDVNPVEYFFIIADHKFNTGDAVQLTTTGSLPTSLSTGTTYYAINREVGGTSGGSIRFATTYENALSNTYINFGGTGSGTHTVQSIVDSTHEPEVRQAFNQVYIMRYKGRPLVWDGVTTATGDVVDSEFESLSSEATLRGGGTATGDPFPDTNITAYIANRLIGVQPREIATPTGADTTIGGITDSSTVILSDLLEPNNYTPSDSEWYINQGAADYVVGFMPYQENNMVIFNRRSLTMATNVQQTNISSRYQITTRYGCLAKKTIAQAGGFVFFLCDEGVMQLNPALDAVTQAGAAVSKLQGAVTPISILIQDQLLDYIDSTDIDKLACGIVNDNKYYLSIQAGAFDGLVKRSRVFVYDLTEGQWSSMDTYPVDIEDLQVLMYNNRPRVFACCKEGWYLVEENAGVDDKERIIGSTSETDTATVASQAFTRSYTFNTNDIKHLFEVEVGAYCNANADAFTITLDSFNPDTTEVLDTYTHSGSAQKVIRRPRTRARGHSFRVKLTVTAGRPEFRYVRLHGTVEETLGSRMITD